MKSGTGHMWHRDNCAQIQWSSIAVPHFFRISVPPWWPVQQHALRFEFTDLV
jgi:hypothetical protein